MKKDIKKNIGLTKKKEWMRDFNKAKTAKFPVRTLKIDGFVKKISDGVVTIKGLGNSTAGELIKIYTSRGAVVMAMVLNLNADIVEAIVLGDESKVKQGALVVPTKRPVTIPISFQMMGRVIDPLGNFLDGKKGVLDDGKKVYKKIDIKAPGIIERQSVFESMQTGLKAVDSMVPIGRGQRELIIGDRQTGKTAVAIDTILNQRENIDYAKGSKILLSDLYGFSYEKEVFNIIESALNK